VWGSGHTVIAVPQGTSLPDKICRDDIETHVLRPTAIEGQYSSMNGRTIRVVGSDVVTVAGFDNPRKVRLLSFETAMTSPKSGQRSAGEPLSLKLMHISRPLIGGLEGPEGSEELWQVLTPQFVAAIRVGYPELECTFAEIDEFSAELNKLAKDGPEALGRIEPILSECVKLQWARAVSAASVSQCFCNSLGKRDEWHETLLAQVLESYLMEGVFDAVMVWLSGRGGSNASLATALRRLENQSLADIGLRQEFRCSQKQVADVIVSATRERTPVSFLLRLREATRVAQEVAQKHVEEHYPDQIESLEMATDDIILALVAAMVDAQPASSLVLPLLQFSKTFHFLPSSATSIGFTLATFEVVLDRLLAKEGMQLVEDGPFGVGVVPRQALPPECEVPIEETLSAAEK
jgi:hypothetical protein